MSILLPGLLAQETHVGFDFESLVFAKPLTTLIVSAILVFLVVFLISFEKRTR